jgi:gliding motility-associated-like protein
LGLGQNGSIDVPISDPDLGSVTIAAYTQLTVGGPWVQVGTPQIVTFVVAPPNLTPPPTSTNPTAYITIIGSTTASTGVSDTDVVQLHLTDGTYDEPPGYPVEFVVTSTGPASSTALLNTTTTSTFIPAGGLGQNGSIDVPISDATAGNVTIAAYTQLTVGGPWVQVGTPQIVTFTAGVAVPGNPGGGGAGGTSPGGGGLPPGGGGSGTGGTGPGGDNTGPGSNSGYTVLFVRQDNQLSNGQQQDSVIAYITDANTNAVVGTAVTFSIEITPNSGTISSGAQFVGSTTVSTDDSGMARIAITSTTPGTVYVVATMVDPTSGNTVLIDGSYQIVTFVDKPDTSNPQTALTVIVYEALADGVSRTAVQAHVVGMNGAVMADQPVTFSIDSGSAQIVTAQPVYTDANGNAIIYLTSTTPGYALVTATVDGLPIDYGSPARVDFAPINIYVPRVFTPNGDGVNDVLKPILVGIASFQYFTVYNRWGNIVYQTTDPNQGWDGTMKGVPQPVETYLWIAAGVDENGKTIVQKGMTSLVR